MTLPAELRVEIASIGQDVTAPVAGFTLTPRDEILLRRGGADGLKIYQDLARDGHTGSVLRKRRQAVVAREWTVDAGGEAPADEQAAELLRAVLRRIRFDRLCQGLLGSVLTGMAVAEVLWTSAELEVGGTRRTWLVPGEVRVRNPRRFRFAADGTLRLLTWDAPLDGIALPERKFLLARFWAEETEDPYGRGLGHDLFWPVFFKRNGIALWNALLERFGQPFVYGEYPAGTPPEERTKLMSALAELGRGSGLVVPQGSLVKLIEAGMAGANTGDAQAKLVAVMNAEISKIVLGETLTTEQGQNGARSLGQVHDGVREELADADADLLSAELQPLCEWITALNLPGAAAPSIHRRKAEQPDLKARADLDTTLFALGWEATEENVLETFGPGYRRIAARGPAPSAPPADFAARRGAASDVAGVPDAGDGPRAPAALAATLAREAEADQQAMLRAFQAEVDRATSFEDLEERLLRLSAALPVTPLARRYAEAMAVAHLAGRSDVLDEGRTADAAR